MALTAKKVYAILKRQISDMESQLNHPVRYKGTVATADLLPLNPAIGDMYNIESKSIYGGAGMNVAWNGVVWDTMGAPIDMSLYLTKEESETVIQRLVTEYFEKNPVKPGATTEQAQQIEQNKTDIASLKTETGSLKEDLASNGLAVNVFDGQFRKGYYASSDGQYVPSESNNEICATNKVKCHSGDIIKIKFPIKISSSRCVVYDANSLLIYTKYFENTELDTSGVDVIEFTIPENGTYFSFNATTGGKSISGTEVYINLKNIKDAIQSNADAIQSNADAIQSNADAIQSVYNAFMNQTKSFERLIMLKNAKLVSLIGISLSPATIELTGKNVLDTESKVIGKIKNDAGEEITDSSFYYSKFIPVTPNENLYFNFGAQRIYQYSYDKSWLRRTSARNIELKLGTFTVPNDCYFIQVQANQNSVNLASAMVTREQDESEYEKYYQYELTISNTDNLPVVLPAYGDTTFYCEENAEVTIRYNESDSITIPACAKYSVWEPSEAPDDYSSEIGFDKVTISITLSQFLSQFFDTYIGEHNNGYTVTKRSIGRDSSNEYELLEYCFKPKHYNRTVLLSAGMNPCETSGMFGIAYLLKNIMDGTDELGLNYLRDNVRFVIIPCINPWGFNQSPLAYYNFNGIRINKNFDYNGSWKQMPSNEKPGESADSEAETKVLKTWLSHWANRAELWIDCHSDTGGNPPHLHQVITSSSTVGAIVQQVQQEITDFYIAKGYITDGTADAVKPSWWTSPLTNYPKTLYSEKIAGIKAMMIEQYPNGAFYGNDGTKNNDSYGIKNYVLMLRAFILAMLKRDAISVTTGDLSWDAYQYSLNN